MNWVFTQIMLLDAATAVVEFAANWLLQSTMLIATGLAAGWLLRRRGSALQSAVYRTTLAAVIVCPLATSLLALMGVSGWSVDLPTAWTYEQLSSPPNASTDLPRAIAMASPQTPGSLVDDAASIEREPLSTETAGSSINLERTPQQESLSNRPADAGLANGLSMGNEPAPASSAASVPASSTVTVLAETWLFHVRAFGLAAMGISLTWLAVSTVLLLRLGLVWQRLNRLRSRADRAETATQRVCRELAELFAVSTPDVLHSPYVASPCLAGVLRPAVLLPEADLPMPVRDV